MYSIHSDVVDIARALIAYPSITPLDVNCLADLSKILAQEGFACDLIQFEDTTNLYARFGHGSPHLCFVGHTDVVPPGPLSSWTFPPFAPTVHQGNFYGRGIADMKGAIACFLSAFAQFKQQAFVGCCSLLLTSDEEGVGTFGIPKMIPWLQARTEIPHVILIGEPTGRHLGEVLQVGRRGSITGHLCVKGIQGHIAYPHLIDNPIPRMMDCLRQLIAMPLDGGNEAFEPSRLEVTSIDTENPTVNVIPEQCQARFGVRFNPEMTSLELCEKISHLCNQYAGVHELVFRCNGDPFFTPSGPWTQCVFDSIKQITGEAPRYTTQGGTTDGRFLWKLAPVVEMGLPECTIHQVNEHVAVEDIYKLRSIYIEILKNYFN